MIKKPSIAAVIIIAFFLALRVDIFAQNVSFPRIEPEAKALEYYRPAGQEYTWNDLAEIGLWASGNFSSANLQKTLSAVSSLNNSNELPSDKKERAEYILTFMHGNYLKSYSLYQTRLGTLFDRGSYNCVSSAVLYVILCESAGISTSGVVTRDHSLVTVHVDGHDIDVETTNRYGFDPGNRKEFHDQFGTLTGFAYVPARNYRDRQTISKIELVSLILHNRVAEHERANRFADAVPLAVDRAALLLGDAETFDTEIKTENTIFEDPRKTLLDRLFNYGASLLKSNKEEDGLRWAAVASVKYPAPDRWQEYILAAVNNRIARYLKEGKRTEARKILDSNRDSLAHENYAHLDSVIIDSELLNRANKASTAAEGDALINDIEQAYGRGVIDEKRAKELLTFSVLKTASSLCAAPSRNWRLAIQYIEKSLSALGGGLNGVHDLEQALRTYRGNLATEYHNRFASEWNKKNFDEAQRILTEGLSEFPADRQLLTDRETVNRNRR